ncbi:MAG: hypothetical protein QM778_30160 [Myxococcales bacterium]
MNDASTKLVLTFLLLQLALPAIVLSRNGVTGHDFSWDMFSHHLSCAQVEAYGSMPSGARFEVTLGNDFPNWAQLSRVLTPERFAQYATTWLCPRLRERHGSPVALHVATRCREQRKGPWFALLDERRDFCGAQ